MLESRAGLLLLGRQAALSPVVCELQMFRLGIIASSSSSRSKSFPTRSINMFIFLCKIGKRCAQDILMMQNVVPNEAVLLSNTKL